MTAADALTRPAGFRHVVVVSGHVTDAPHRSPPRFPEARVDAVEQQVGDCLRRWAVGADDLLICGGARGADLVAAHQARAMGATVWILLAHPAAEFVRTSVAGADPSWIERFWHLLQRVPSWTMPPSYDAGQDVYEATNDWMLRVARAQATDHPPHLLAVWDGQPGDGPGGTAHMVEQFRGLGADVSVVDPLDEPSARSVS